MIRDFRPNNRGIRVWGARVITSDPDWKYVNVRRLFIFIENSHRPRPAVGGLRAQRRAAVGAGAPHRSATSSPRSGATARSKGTKPEEAFFVKCDRTTMTQDDIDNGRLIVVIGVAPVKPAEFVIIRIGLWTAHAED